MGPTWMKNSLVFVVIDATGHLVEHATRLKDYRRIATRFDRDIKNFFAALCILAAVIWRL